MIMNYKIQLTRKLGQFMETNFNMRETRSIRDSRHQLKNSSLTKTERE